MSNEIKINVSGGSAAFGSLVQGDRNTVTGVSANVQQSFEKAKSAIAEEGAALGRPAAEVQEVLEALERLKAEATASAPNAGKGSAILKAIKDNFDWAYPMVKDVLAVAWPALLALLA